MARERQPGKCDRRKLQFKNKIKINFANIDLFCENFSDLPLNVKVPTQFDQINYI